MCAGSIFATSAPASAAGFFYAAGTEYEVWDGGAEGICYQIVKGSPLFSLQVHGFYRILGLTKQHWV